MVERRTIRPRKDTYNTLNEDRKEKGLSWDDYLEKLQSGDPIEVRIPEDQVNTIAERAAREVQEAMRR